MAKCMRMKVHKFWNYSCWKLLFTCNFSKVTLYEWCGITYQFISGKYMRRRRGSMISTDVVISSIIVITTITTCCTFIIIITTMTVMTCVVDVISSLVLHRIAIWVDHRDEWFWRGTVHKHITHIPRSSINSFQFCGNNVVIFYRS